MRLRIPLKVGIASLIIGLILVAVQTHLRAKRPEFHIYTWADYIKPEIVEQFERRHNCRVVIDTFDSNESMYARLKAGAGGYDLLFPSSYMVRLMAEQEMLEPLDHAQIPNLTHIDPEYLKIALDREMRHSVPYMITRTGLAYLKGRVSNPEPSWAMLDRADLKGRMTMLNDMRESLGAALKFLGYSLNTRDEKQLAEARDVLIRWKTNLAKFENEQYKTGLASGEFLLVHGYGGDILQVRQENEDVAFILPREGHSVTCDDMVIPKGARQAALAHAFINFLHDPAIAAVNMEFTQYLCPNTTAYGYLTEAARADPMLFPPEDVRARGEVILDLGADNALYTRVWDEVKAASERTRTED